MILNHSIYEDVTDTNRIRIYSKSRLGREKWLDYLQIQEIKLEEFKKKGDYQLYQNTVWGDSSIDPNFVIIGIHMLSIVSNFWFNSLLCATFCNFKRAKVITRQITLNIE